MFGRALFFLDSVSFKIVLWLFLLLMIALAFSSISINLTILTFFGFLPSIVAISIDTYEKKVLSRIVVLFNVLGSLSFFIQIISDINEIERISYMIISIPNTWFIIYSSCTFGVGLYILIPKIAYCLIYTKKMDLLRKLKNELNDIYQEWGKESIKTDIAKLNGSKVKSST